VKSLQRVVRGEMHQRLHLGKGHERGGEASMIVVRAEKAEESHWSSWLGEGASGGGVTS